MTASFSRRDITLANWRTHPFTAYSFQNVAEFVPSADVNMPREDTPFRGLDALDGLTVKHRFLGKTSVADFLAGTHGDVFAVLKDGELLAEWQAPHASIDAPHLVFSVTKSVTGMLAGIAWGDGVLDPDAPISAYVPTSPDCAYSSASVRDLLDMTVRLDFVEDYLNVDGPFDRYRRAMLWNPERSGLPQESMLDVLSTLPRSAGNHGEVFFYASPNTDMLGLVIEAATGRRYHEFLRDRLWRPMGATGTARITVDRKGAARAAGGLSVTARDLARLGDLVMNKGRIRDGQQLIPAAWIDDMLRNGSHDAWKAGGFPGFFPTGNYRSCWYVAEDGRGGFAADGIHGQRLWVDPTSRVSIAKLSSFPSPSDDVASAADFEVLAQIAKAL
jgi:CubicO group peptidase (beta-lactamase class C family)